MTEKNKKLELAAGMINSDNSKPTVQDPYMKVNDDNSMSFFYDLAQGAVVTRDDFNTVTWDTNTAGWETAIPNGHQSKIKKAMKYYSSDPLVNKSVNLLSQLANDSFKIVAEDKSTELFFNQWWKDIGGIEFLAWFFKEFFRSGNVPVFKTLVPYNPQEYDNKKVSTKSQSQSKSSNDAKFSYEKAYDLYQLAVKANRNGKLSDAMLLKAEQALGNAIVTWSMKSIPGAYTILNPLSIEIAGPDDLPWLRQVYLKVNDDIKKAVKAPSKELKPVINMIPKEILKQIQAGVDKVLLPDYLCTVVTRDKQPYETWAEPLTTHAFEALDYKKELREMDRHTVRGVRNRILKVTIGNDKYPCFDATAIKKLSTEFNNPSRNLTIFWNHTLDISYIEPNLDSLNIEKYEPADRDIRTCFGIAEILTGGQGQAIGNNVLNLKGLVEVLSEAQDTFLVWFHQEAKRIREALGLSETPTANFGKLNLKDVNEYMKVLAQLVDRQVISYETMVETIGYHFPKEIDRLKKEKKLRDKDGILIAQKAPTQTDSGTDPSGQEGRPSGNTETERKSSQQKPKSPGGTKIVASMNDNKPTYKELFESCSAIYDEFYQSDLEKIKSQGKNITQKRKDTAMNIAIASTLNKQIEYYDLDTVSELCVLKAYNSARDLQKAMPEKHLEDVISSAMAFVLFEFF